MKPYGNDFPNGDISKKRAKSNMEEETQTKEKVETDMEEENINTVGTMTTKIREVIITHPYGNARIVM